MVKKPLSAPEFVPPLAKIDPIYKEEEEAFKVLSIKVYSQDFCVPPEIPLFAFFRQQTWYTKTPLGKKRLKAAMGDEDGDKKGKKGGKGKKSGKKGKKKK